MQLDLQAGTPFVKLLIYYLMIGWCTQLPGGLFRRYLPLWMLRENYDSHGTRALLDTPFVWIPFTILLWPIPFLRVGANRSALVLVVVGVLSSAALISYITTLSGALVVVILAGLGSVYLVKPRTR